MDLGIDLEKYTSNPNVIFLETSHGNHFGFYEGGFCSAFSNTSSYTYPPRVALAFLEEIFSNLKNDGDKHTYKFLRNPDDIFFKMIEEQNSVDIDLDLIESTDYS